MNDELTTTAPDVDAAPPGLWQKLKPEELAALEAFFASEVSSALAGEYVPPDVKALTLPAVNVLLAMGLIQPTGQVLTEARARELNLLPRLLVFGLSHAGRYEYGCYAATLDYDENGDVIPPASRA